MTPIKLNDLLARTSPAQKDTRVMDLAELGLFHSAPRENDKPLLALRFDAQNGTLVPAA